jgi:hypothetical protein
MWAWLPSSVRRVPVVSSLGAGLLAVSLGVWTENWLSALLIALSLLLVVLVVLLIRVLIQRERQEQLVRGLEGPRPAPGGFVQTGARAPSVAVSLEERFRDALSEMRQHFGSREGVYELPWFLVIGDVGAGKSLLLQECGLDVPARYARRGFGPTDSCEFVLANEAIALDTPGRWFRCASDRDRDEWRKLLELLRRNRPECPINGAIVAIPVPLLLSQNRAELEEHGRELRRRLNELRVNLGVDAPVYIVLTKADALEGFVDTVRLMPPGWLQQALGWTNDQRRLADAEQRIERELLDVADRLESFLPELLKRENDPLRQLRIFAYPQELGALAKAAAVVVGTAFKRDAYETEAPFLRGVYFASARTEGAAISPTLARLGVHAAIGRRGDAPLRGLFLRDLMLEIARGDENLAVTDSRIGPLGRRAIGSAAGLVAVLVVALWGISFVQNYQGLERLTQWAERAMLPDPPLADLEDLRARLVAERRNASSPIQWLGFGALARGVARGQSTYTWAFLRSFDTLTRANMLRALEGDDQDAVQAAIDVTTDLTFLERRGEDAGAPTLDRYLPGSIGNPQIYGPLYVSFVQWLGERQRLELRRTDQDALDKRIGKLLQLAVLERITSDPQGAYPPVRYSDFDLERPAQAPGQAPSRSVAGIYTALGQEKLIQVLLNAVEKTPDAVAPNVVADFKRQYSELYTTTWRSFLRDVPLRARARADVKTSGYLKFLEVIDANTRKLPGDAKPAWVEMLQAIRKSEEGTLEKLPIPGRDEALKELGPPWAAYMKALEPVHLEVERAGQASEQALAVARDVMQGNKESPFLIANKRVEYIVNLVLANSTDAEIKEKLKQVMKAPVLDGVSEVFGGAVPELQRSWQQKVVSRYPNPATSAALKEYGTGAQEFVNQDLGPFWRDGQSRSFEGRQMPFGPGASRWIQALETRPAGPQGPQPLVLRTVPSKVIGGATRLQPTNCKFELFCPSGPQALDYTDGGSPRTKTLQWDESCRQIELRCTLVTSDSKPAGEASEQWDTMQKFLADEVKGDDFSQWEVDGPPGVKVQMRFKVSNRPQFTRGIPPPPASLGN